jgi:uncharacterized membrane protein
MKKHLRIFLAGIMVVVPLAITGYVVWSAGAWVDDMGGRLLQTLGSLHKPPPGLGIVLLLAAIYLIGLLTRFWSFRVLFGWLERLMGRLPGVKTIYESVRDLMKLFGGEARRSGRAVMYKLPGTDVALLGIMTNDQPTGGRAAVEDRVAVFMPFSYMLGGPTILVPRKNLQEVNLSVDQVMKICTTAYVGGPAAPQSAPASAPDRGNQKQGA